MKIGFRWSVLVIVGILGPFLAVFSGFAFGTSGGLATLMEEGTVILDYFVSDETTSISVITCGGVQTASRIAITQHAIAEQVLSFREEIVSPPMTGQEAASYLSALEKGHDLYELLIAPVENYFQGAAHLIIIPSGVLSFLPFEALLNCSGCEKRDLYRGKFLIEDYSISYASSLRSLELLLQGTREKEVRSILAVGNASGYSPCSQREVDDIATLFPERTVLIGGEATPEAMKHLLKARNYDIVHLATGCLSLDVQAPLLSGIRFPIAGDENGIFRIDEFFGLTGSIDLLTLSIGLTIQPLRENQSDDDKITASSGEAFRSLTDEILASGAAATIIPLWHVNNFATGKLMEVMYQELIQGTAKDEALREAKQSLLRDPVYHNPYFWAQFVLYGDWSAMSSARPPDTGKLDYVLYQALQEWKSREHAPDEAPPFVSVVVTLAHPAIQEDLGRLRAISDEIEIQGAFGNFVQLRLPLSLLDAVCALSEVRSVATPTGTISN